MTKIIILAVIAVTTITIIAMPKITTKPFSVTFSNGRFAIGILFLSIGVGFIRYQGYKDGVKNGIDETFKHLKEEIREQKNIKESI
jgi:amino acid transporter